MKYTSRFTISGVSSIWIALFFMIKMEGWIKLHRKIQHNELWLSEPFTRGQAWVDLILLANHENGFFYLRGNKINVNRGQVGYSQLKLAERWMWSRSKVKKFLNDLEKEQQIQINETHVTTVITVINYDEYQKKEQQDVQQKSNRKATEKQQKSTNKNDKNDKNEKKINNHDFPVGFEGVILEWMEYKKERRETYKEIGLKKFISSLISLSGNNPEKAQKIIDRSITNNWAGIFEMPESKKHNLDVMP